METDEHFLKKTSHKVLGEQGPKFVVIFKGLVNSKPYEVSQDTGSAPAHLRKYSETKQIVCFQFINSLLDLLFASHIILVVGLSFVVHMMSYCGQTCALLLVSQWSS